MRVVLHDTEPCGRGVALPFADACKHLGVELIEAPVGIVPKRFEYEALAQSIAGSGMRSNMAVCFIRDAGAHADGTLITFGGVPPGLLEGRGRAFYERYVERFGLEPECYAASADDATGVILEAIERVGCADRDAITRAAFATRDFDGLLGRWSFDQNGDSDVRRGTRLTVRSGAFQPLTVLPIVE